MAHWTNPVQQRLWRSALLGALLMWGCSAPAQRDPQSDQATGSSGAGFVDRFENVDDRRWLISDGWSNGHWTANEWRRSQIAIRDGGGFEITLAPIQGGDKPFASGELQSRRTYRQGYFEVKMQVPRGSGLVTGFFTFTRPRGEQTWDEIDVEILGRDPRSVQFTYFRQGRPTSVTLPLGFDASEGQHIYAIEWAPDHIRWHVDGALRHEAPATSGPLPESAQRIYLHLWNSETLTSWLGPIDPSQQSWRLVVTCIGQATHYSGDTLCG